MRRTLGRPQRWRFDNYTGEVVNAGSEEAAESGATASRLCLGWEGHIGRGTYLVSHTQVVLVACDGGFRWDPSFFLETTEAEPVHGTRPKLFPPRARIPPPVKGVGLYVE